MTGLSWRFCWALFAISGFMVLLANWRVLRTVEKAPDDDPLVTENGPGLLTTAPLALR